MIRYISLQTHLHSGFLLVHSGVFEFTRRHNGVDTSITLDSAKLNFDGAELSSCVVTLFYWIMYYNIWDKFNS